MDSTNEIYEGEMLKDNSVRKTPKKVGRKSNKDIISEKVEKDKEFET